MIGLKNKLHARLNLFSLFSLLSDVYKNHHSPHHMTGLHFMSESDSGTSSTTPPSSPLRSKSKKGRVRCFYDLFFCENIPIKVIISKETFSGLVFFLNKTETSYIICPLCRKYEMEVHWTLNLKTPFLKMLKKCLVAVTIVGLFKWWGAIHSLYDQCNI